MKKTGNFEMNFLDSYNGESFKINVNVEIERYSGDYWTPEDWEWQVDAKTVTDESGNTMDVKDFEAFYDVDLNDAASDYLEDNYRKVWDSIQ